MDNVAYETKANLQSDESGALRFTQVDGKGFEPAGSRSKDKIADMEPIDSMKVPDKWSKEIEDGAFESMSKSVTFRPPDAPGAVLSVYDRGFPIASSEAARFKDLLEREPHEMTEAEFNKLGKQMLGNLGDQSAFNFKAAETKIVNGKKVLAVEGKWQGGKEFYGLFVPKDESCKQIQEVFFEGPKNEFASHFDKAKQSIDSIEWTRERFM